MEDAEESSEAVALNEDPAVDITGTDLPAGGVHAGFQSAADQSAPRTSPEEETPKSASSPTDVGEASSDPSVEAADVQTVPVNQGTEPSMVPVSASAGPGHEVPPAAEEAVVSGRARCIRRRGDSDGHRQ